MEGGGAHIGLQGICSGVLCSWTFLGPVNGLAFRLIINFV